MISLVINCDTRPIQNVQHGLFSGVVNEDFLTDGIENKINFLKGFEIEVIIFIDKHLEIPEKTLEYLHSVATTLVIRKHTDEEKFNDYNYLSALFLARGEIIMHIDQDTSVFAKSREYVEELIRLLETYKFVSYPSYWSPKPVHDESFGIRTWASTRFFICKREALRFDTLIHCLKDADWAYKTFGDSPRRCNWLEHFLTLTNNDSCFYPPIEPNKGLIFSWGSYEKWTLRRLNTFPYEEVVKFIEAHPIQYPVDVYI